jgi:hypothetical protein
LKRPFTNPQAGLHFIYTLLFWSSIFKFLPQGRKDNRNWQLKLEMGRLFFTLSLSSRLIFILTTFSAVNAQKNRTARLEIIFPINGKTYQPTYPFPIVFGLENTSAMKAYGLDFNWKLYNIYSGEEFEDRKNFYGPNSPDSVNRQLVVYGSQKLVNASEGEIALTLDFGLSHFCDTSGTIVTEGDGYYRRFITFNISRSLGTPLPALAGDGSCAIDGLSSFSISIGGEVNSHWLTTCPLVLPAGKDKPPCGFPRDAAVAGNVTAQMLETAHCKTATWQNPTGLVNSCPISRASRRKDIPIFLSYLVLLISLY